MKYFKYIFLISILISAASFPFVDNAHQNFPEDALLFMEREGSNQQRWAADFLKAKAGGRYQNKLAQNGDYDSAAGRPKFGDVYGNSGSKTVIPDSTRKSDYTGTVPQDCFDPKDFAEFKDPKEGPFVGVGCGIMGIARAGGVGPDYFRDTWWWDTTTSGWKFTAPDFTKIGDLNYSSAFHFINLLNKAASGWDLTYNVYNDYDGYSFNAAYDFDSDTSKDGLVAIFFNNAQMTIDLKNCTACTTEGGVYTLANNGINPATSYKQNGSTTPVGTPSSDGKKLANGNGSNYNCYSDGTAQNCPDEGDYICKDTTFGICTTWQYYRPNTKPGNGGTAWADQDWIIYEPADNASTFFYNELFLEGGNSRSGTNENSLQTAAIVGRYYTIDATSLFALSVPSHWAGDINQPMHVWSTLGNNHSEYEAYADKYYGPRYPAGCYDSPSNAAKCDSSKNIEGNYSTVKAFINSRVKRYYNGIDDLLMENAWLTYAARLRPAQDVLTQANDGARGAMLQWSVPSAISTIALIFEKGVMDIRRCRTGTNCSSTSNYQMKY